MQSALDLGLVGGILGGSIGVAGGVFGTWCSIRSARGPRERSWVITFSICVWIGVALFVAGLLALPKPYNWLLWVPYSVALPLAVLWCSRKQQALRAEESVARAE